MSKLIQKDQVQWNSRVQEIKQENSILKHLKSQKHPAT